MIGELIQQGRRIDELLSLFQILVEAYSGEEYEIPISVNGKEVKVTKNTLYDILNLLSNSIEEADKEFHRIQDNLIR